MRRSIILSLLLAAAPAFAAEIDFAHEVVPVLKQHCGKCHTGDQKKGGLSLNTRETTLVGGESGKVVVSGKSAESELIQRLTSDDPDVKMPPEGPRVPAEQVALLKAWIDAGLPWERGFTFGQRPYEPPLKPRRPELPAATDGRTHPVDRLIDAHLAAKQTPRPKAIGDATFARRVHLDLIGLLPEPEELEKFLADKNTDKRTKLVRELLSRDIQYAEHWLTFWNDLLRNDYTGTGFITGGRKQITKWLYHALVTNMPYDQFARELIAPPSQDSVGFGEGIRWRGEVSAGQTVEIQFAQSVGQSFLGINLKCASCHDSFIDRWTLDESYGLAAVFSQRPLEIHRCDKPVGKQAQAAWLFPELGQIDAKAPQPERLKQLATLMTHPENGRFPRTIVNRLWHRLMGRGLVHPTDAMQTEPWSIDLLDHLASDLVEKQYDLKQTLELIVTSQAYQGASQVVMQTTDDAGFVYAGPRAKRLTAEQFMDAVWQLTESAPRRYDAQIIRGKPAPGSESPRPLAGKWIWGYADTHTSPANETFAFKTTWDLKAVPLQAVAVITCDNSYVLSINGARVEAGDNWEQPQAVLITSRLKAGPNEIVIVAKNGGASPNAAGLFCEFQARTADGETLSLGTNETWSCSKTLPDGNGKYKTPPTDWQPAALVAHPQVWSKRLDPVIASLLVQAAQSSNLMVRASLVKCDFLMKSLGRPNRDQIVSVRPEMLTTLEAIDLSNGETLADILNRGAKKLLARSWDSPQHFARWLWRYAISRDPTPQELEALTAALGDKLTEQGIEDVLWAAIMLPEFQLVR
ncbi:MAG: DUF1549 domain-containing protein [Candidatus Saccharimonas sp.]|nr:DUF1549 domain-containing protein [Planctomycetaceae bacterium]